MLWINKLKKFTITFNMLDDNIFIQGDDQFINFDIIPNVINSESDKLNLLYNHIKSFGINSIIGYIRKKLLDNTISDNMYNQFITKELLDILIPSEKYMQDYFMYSIKDTSVIHNALYIYV